MARPHAIAARSEPARSAGAVRCVVLCAKGDHPPEVLLAALQKRGLEPESASDPFRAMLALTRQPPSDDLGATGRPPALIVVEPERFASATLEDLLDAAPRRAPGLVIWEYDERARPPLRARLAPARSSPPAPPTNAPPARSVETRPRRPEAPLRLTGERLPVPPGAPPVDDTPENLLSEEELTMLLADETPDHDDR